MEAPRVLCLIDTVGKGGGAEHLIAVLAPRLRRAGLNVEVAVLHEWPINYADAIENEAVPVHRFGGGYARIRPDTVLKLGRLLRERKYDLVWGHLHAGNAHARIGALLGRSKSVVTLHSEGYGANPPRRLRDKLAVAYEGMVLGGATARVAVSNAVAADYSRYFGWTDVAVAYNGVDVDHLRALATSDDGGAATRAKWDVTAQEFLMVTAARYVSKKGQIHLLEALALLRDGGETGLRLVLCGEGVESSPLHAEIARLGLAENVSMLGVLDQTELMPLIAAADAYVMPSLREPFGIAAAEAMALGTPTILTEVDGFLELVGDSGAALMAPPANPQMLAERIMQIRRDPGAARAMGQMAAQRMADRFSLDACAHRWIEIFRAVHEGRAIPPCAA